MELSSISEPMRTLSAEEFADLLAQADLPQAGFARLAGISPRQVNKWCRGHAAVPRWAAVLALAMRELSAEALVILLEELQVTSHPAGGHSPQF
jgi:transcriptional regulator with XRE-family HTH domain